MERILIISIIYFGENENKDRVNQKSHLTEKVRWLHICYQPHIPWQASQSWISPTIGVGSMPCL